MRNHHWVWLACVALIVVTAAASVVPVSAQKAITTLRITGIDFSTFPDVWVTAVIRDNSNVPVPVADLEQSQGMVTLLENNLPVKTSFERISGGMDIMLVLDGYASGETIRQFLDQFLPTTTRDDSIGVFLINEEEGVAVRTSTRDRDALNEALGKMKLGQASQRLSGTAELLKAFVELKNSPYQTSSVQTLILVSSGEHSLTEIDLEKLTKTAADQKVALQLVSLRGNTFATSEFAKVAAATGGESLIYTDAASLGKLISWMETQRTQYRFKFRSTVGVSSERTVELQTASSGVSDFINYKVDLTPPQVVITSPANGVEITRNATYDEAQMGMEGVKPTEQDIVAKVTWPDGFARAITEARFFIDGKEVSNPVTFPGERILFTWDLRPYRTVGTTSVELRVQVLDELGFSSISDQLVTKMVIIHQPAPTPAFPTPTLTPQEVCSQKEGFSKAGCSASAFIKYELFTTSGILSISSLLVAIGAIGVAARYRGKIVQVGGQAISNIRETMARFGDKTMSAEVGAYLEVLRGDNALQGKPIPLYKNTPTPVGRNPEEVELVFHHGIERSVVSRRHCEFREANGTFKLRDLSSSHGTFVNGMRLPEGGEGVPLTNGDKIELGPAERGGVLLLFKLADGALTSSHSPDEEKEYVTNPGHSDYGYDA